MHLLGLESRGGQTGHKRGDGGHATIKQKNKEAQELVAFFLMVKSVAWSMLQPHAPGNTRPLLCFVPMALWHRCLRLWLCLSFRCVLAPAALFLDALAPPPRARHRNALPIRRPCSPLPLCCGAAWPVGRVLRTAGTVVAIACAAGRRSLTSLLPRNSTVRGGYPRVPRPRRYPVRVRDERSCGEKLMSIDKYAEHQLNFTSGWDF